MATLEDPELGRRPPRGRSRGALSALGVTRRVASAVQLAALTALGPLTGASPRRSGGPAILAAAVVGVLLGLLVVWQQTEAAFTASSGTAASWGSASLTLTDDDTGSALINATAAAGQTGTACLTVTYAGTVSSPVKLYATSASDPDALGAQVSLTVEEGSGGTFAGGCAGFTPSGTAYNGTFGSFLTSATNYGSGVGSWTADPVTSTSRSYRFSWTLGAGTSSTLQGKSVAATLVWETRA